MRKKFMLFVLFATLIALSANTAWAFGVQWWKDTKKRCNLDPNLVYEHWNGVCNDSSPTTNYPSAATQASNINEDGRNALSAGNYDLAIELFERAYATYPDQVYIHNKKLAQAAKYAAKASEAWDVKDWDGAIRYYGDAYSFDPDQVYLDNISKAKDNKKRSIARKYAAEASAAWDVKDWDQAIVKYELAYSFNPIQVYLDNISKARNHKKKQISHNYNEEGRAALSAENYDRAIELFERANANNPNQVYVNNRQLALGKKYAAKAKSAWAAGDWDKAAQLYAEAYDADPNQSYLNNIEGAKKNKKKTIARENPDSWERRGKLTTEFKPNSVALVSAMDAASGKSTYNERGHFSKENHWEEAKNESLIPMEKGKPTDNAHLLEKNCQTFFREVGEELAKRDVKSWSDTFPGGKKNIGKQSADEIVAFINDGSKTSEWTTWKKKKWRKVDNWVDAQNLANQGAIVIGGKRKEKTRGNGHLGFVVPMPTGQDFLETGTKGNNGPLVRDGNEHLYNHGQEISASSWGAVRASKAFGKNWEKTASWYVWVPSEK